MSSMGLFCGRALVESRLSGAPSLPASIVEEEAEKCRGRWMMESAGGDDGVEEGGEWAWPLEAGDGCGDREDGRRAAQRTGEHCHSQMK